ncbi:MAG: 2Fe-2S iron-sulfur cluster binding domain-containing protein [Betaproteobacteria bacterium]|nr:2Fe-2S iron-sulfur cluster binding domain-containing protein [Betaproteobacteria bacterium]
MSLTISIDGSGVRVAAEPGDTVLDALLMAGVGFPYSCQAGNCGTCRCELLEGEVLELEASEHALADEDRARGQVLACRTQVWGDVVIRRLDDEEFVVHPSRRLECVVDSVERLTHDILGLRLAILSGGPFLFSAGQYAALEFSFSPGVSRDYSMASTPGDGHLEFFVRERRGGGVSDGLSERLHVGDRVRVSGPFGSAFLREGHEGPVIAVAGGSGLAPIRSILATLRARRTDQPVHLYFGARTERDVFGEREMIEWTRPPGSSLQIVLADTMHRSKGPGARRAGLVTDALDADLDDLLGAKAYVAGPPAMVEAAVAVLERKGVPSRDIHADAFYPAQGSETSDTIVA